MDTNLSGIVLAVQFEITNLFANTCADIYCLSRRLRSDKQRLTAILEVFKDSPNTPDCIRTDSEDFVWDFVSLAPHFLSISNLAAKEMTGIFVMPV